MKELNFQETKQINGGWWVFALRLIGPSLLNMAVHSFKKKHRGEEITPQGLAIAGGAGLVGAGIGVAGGAAAGGTLVGNLVWAPNGAAISAAGNAISDKY